MSNGNINAAVTSAVRVDSGSGETSIPTKASSKTRQMGSTAKIFFQMLDLKVFLTMLFPSGEMDIKCPNRDYTK